MEMGQLMEQMNREPRLASLEDHLEELRGKRVLLRVDINVPLTAENRMLCDYRLRRMAGVVRRLLRIGCSVIVMSHLGQPGGKRSPFLSLKPFVEPFAQQVGYPVQFCPSYLGPEAPREMDREATVRVRLLENLRFHPGEEQPAWEFASQLARLGDVYVNDAFAVSHRPHASVILLPRLLPAYAGPAFLDEYRRVQRLLEVLRPPVVGISGGRKLDKLVAYERLLPMFDRLLLGSGFAGEASCSALLGEHFDRVVFPLDVIARTATGNLRVVRADKLHPGETIVDLGPETAHYYCAVAREAGTILVNGSLGLLPLDHPLSPTRQLLREVVTSSAIKVVCGGTGCALFLHEGYGQQIDYLFPGGGATLNFLDGRTNAALEALQKPGCQTAQHAAYTVMPEDEAEREGEDG